MPNAFFIVLAIIGGCLTLLLPETKSKELPDSIDEVAEKEDLVE